MQLVTNNLFKRTLSHHFKIADALFAQRWNAERSKKLRKDRMKHQVYFEPYNMILSNIVLPGTNNSVAREVEDTYRNCNL